MKNSADFYLDFTLLGEHKEVEEATDGMWYIVLFCFCKADVGTYELTPLLVAAIHLTGQCHQ